MKTFKRDNIKTHDIEDGNFEPNFLGTVTIGESFTIETEDSNDVNGPIAVEGIRAGDDIVVHLEDIEIIGPVGSPNGGPLDGFAGCELEHRDGYLFFPDHFKIKPRPTIGNIAVLPGPAQRDNILAWARNLDFGKGRIGYEIRRWRQMVNDPRGKHCHQDCPFWGPGTAIHMKAQVDGAGVCMADFHVYMSEGEMSFNGVSAAANIRAHVERSEGWFIDWPLIETEDEIMVFSSGEDYVQVVRQAFRACRQVVAHKAGCSIEEANNLVA